MYREIKCCRACSGTDLIPVLDLGVQPLANNFVKPGEARQGFAPLKVLSCRTCTLAQLSVVVNPEILYKDYPYVTGDGPKMKAHFKKLYDAIISSAGLPSHRRNMLEIGSNTGGFLNYSSKAFDALGFEPASNLAAIAEAKGFRTINRFFDLSSATSLSETGYKADVVVARHVFAHIDDWRGFIQGLDLITHKDSLVVIEVPYVGDMLAMNSWDQIYHEHLSFVGITPIVHLLKGSNFYLRDVHNYDIHGGVVALFLRKVGFDGSYQNDIRVLEKDYDAAWVYCSDCKDHMLSELKSHVRCENRDGKKICGFGASAKASVWINACRFTSKDIAFVCDKAETKIGKLIPGTDIPVVPHDRLYEADYAINFAWNWAEEIMEEHKGFKEKGGKWILPVPSIHIV
jgi:hypothetical protein